MLLPFSPRFIVLTICAVVTALLLGLGIVDHKVFDLVLIPLVVFGALTLLGIRDIIQKNHAVLRNYPISAHLRFLLEEIRPEMRQYFFESETDGLPFSRNQRAIVYQRAKMVLDKRPFGTQLDVYARATNGCSHSIAPQGGRRREIPPQDRRPRLHAALFSLGVQYLGDEFRRAQRQRDPRVKPRREVGGFAHDTGEGGYSPHHREGGGDMIWEIGSGYFGCRDRDGGSIPKSLPPPPPIRRSR